MSKREIEKRIEHLERLAILRRLPGTFDLQRNIILDPSKNFTICCGRRSGKTYSLAWRLIRRAWLSPGSLSVYCTPYSQDGTEEIILGPMDSIMKENPCLGGLWDSKSFMYRFPNGSKVWVKGIPTSLSWGILRGKKYHEFILDECQDFKWWAKRMITKAVQPALMDYNGTLVAAGTVSDTVGSFWDRKVTQKGAVKADHMWTAKDNPYINDFDEFIARVIDDNKSEGWTITHPILRREYFNERPIDASELLFSRFSRESNCIIHEEQFGNYVLAIDLGSSDSESIKWHRDVRGATSICVTGWNTGSGNCVVVYQKNHETPGMSDVAREVLAALQRYPTAMVIGDYGGLGRGYLSDLTTIYKISVLWAEKGDKKHFFEILNTAFKDKMLAIVGPNCEALVEDLESLRKDAKDTPHSIDSMLYGYRYARVRALPSKSDAEAEAAKAAKKRAEEMAYMAKMNRGARQW